MASGPAARWLLIGNSGSGKSTRAERVGRVLRLPVHDLDPIHWHTGGRKREQADARGSVGEIAAGDGWVIEGVYGWLAEVALPRVDALVWLDLSWEECRAGLPARGLRRGMTPGDQEAVLAWARDYWTRTTPSSFTGHERLYRMFAGHKTRLCARDEIAALVPSQSSFR